MSRRMCRAGIRISGKRAALENGAGAEPGSGVRSATGRFVGTRLVGRHAGDVHIGIRPLAEVERFGRPRPLGARLFGGPGGRRGQGRAGVRGFRQAGRASAGRAGDAAGTDGHGIALSRFRAGHGNSRCAGPTAPASRGQAISARFCDRRRDSISSSAMPSQSSRGHVLLTLPREDPTKPLALDGILRTPLGCQSRSSHQTIGSRRDPHNLRLIPNRPQ